MNNKQNNNRKKIAFLNIKIQIMKKILLSLIVSLLITFGASAQSINDSFFDHVNYIGAFDGTFNWTTGWI